MASTIALVASDELLSSLFVGEKGWWWAKLWRGN